MLQPIITTFTIGKGADALGNITTYNADGSVNAEITKIWIKGQRRLVEGICPNGCQYLDISDPHKLVCKACGFVCLCVDEFRI